MGMAVNLCCDKLPVAAVAAVADRRGVADSYRSHLHCRHFDGLDLDAVQSKPLCHWSKVTYSNPLEFVVPVNRIDGFRLIRLHNIRIAVHTKFFRQYQSDEQSNLKIFYLRFYRRFLFLLIIYRP